MAAQRTASSRARRDMQKGTLPCCPPAHFCALAVVQAGDVSLVVPQRHLQGAVQQGSTIAGRCAMAAHGSTRAAGGRAALLGCRRLPLAPHLLVFDARPAVLGSSLAQHLQAGRAGRQAGQSGRAVCQYCALRSGQPPQPSPVHKQWPPQRPRTFLCCSCSLQGSLAGLSSQSPPPPLPPPAALPPAPIAVTCTRPADCVQWEWCAVQSANSPAAMQARCPAQALHNHGYKQQRQQRQQQQQQLALISSGLLPMTMTLDPLFSPDSCSSRASSNSWAARGAAAASNGGGGSWGC